MIFDDEGTLMSDTAGTRAEPLNAEEEADLRRDQIDWMVRHGLAWSETNARLLATLDRDRAASPASPEPPGLVPANLFAEDREFRAQVEGWHLTNGNMDAMNAALSRTFPIYSDEEAGTDIDGDAVTMLDTLINNGQIVVNAVALKAALRATPVAGSTIPDRPLDVLNVERLGRAILECIKDSPSRKAWEDLSTYAQSIQIGKAYARLSELAAAYSKAEAPVT